MHSRRTSSNVCVSKKNTASYVTTEQFVRFLNRLQLGMCISARQEHARTWVRACRAPAQRLPVARLMGQKVGFLRPSNKAYGAAAIRQRSSGFHVVPPPAALKAVLAARHCYWYHASPNLLPPRYRRSVSSRPFGFRREFKSRFQARVAARVAASIAWSQA